MFYVNVIFFNGNNIYNVLSFKDKKFKQEFNTTA